MEKSQKYKYLSEILHLAPANIGGVNICPNANQSTGGGGGISMAAAEQMVLAMVVATSTTACANSAWPPS